VLAGAAGGTVGDVAAGLGSSRATAPKWRSRFLASRLDGLIDAAAPKAWTCTWYAIHRRLLKHPRFHLHFTPASSSWMNLAERWLAELTRRKLRRSAHRSVTELEAGIRTWISEWNKDPRPFIWTKTADEILETLAAYCERIIDSRH
jgi:transposase